MDLHFQESLLPSFHKVADRYEVRDKTNPVKPFRLLRADDAMEKDEVALFLVPRGSADDPDQAGETLRTLVETLSGNPHPLFLNVLSSGREDGFFFMVEEQPQGRSLLYHLQEKRKNGKPFSTMEALVLCWLLCRAVQSLHRFTVHGFVNPQEVFLEPWRDGPIPWYPKIAHPGVRAILRSGSMAFDGLEAEARFHAAPEFIAQQPVTEGTDFYGVGSLLYSMLTLRPPTGCFVRPGSLHPGFPESLDLALLRVLEEDPIDRYPSPTAFFHALKDQAGLEFHWEAIEEAEKRLMKPSRDPEGHALSLVRWKEEEGPAEDTGGAARTVPRAYIWAFLLLLSLVLLGAGFWEVAHLRQEGQRQFEEFRRWEKLFDERTDTPVSSEVRKQENRE